MHLSTRVTDFFSCAVQDCHGSDADLVGGQGVELASLEGGAGDGQSGDCYQGCARILNLNHVEPNEATEIRGVTLSGQACR
jgi:hypothetical protein